MAGSVAKRLVVVRSTGRPENIGFDLDCRIAHLRMVAAINRAWRIAADQGAGLTAALA
jgi:hypothetical protein